MWRREGGETLRTDVIRKPLFACTSWTVAPPRGWLAASIGDDEEGIAKEGMRIASWRPQIGT